MLALAGCPTEPNTIIEKPQPGTPINKTIDGINFKYAEGLTQAEIDGIEAKLLAMTPAQIEQLSGFQSYVASVTIIQTGNRNISLNDKNEAVIATTFLITGQRDINASYGVYGTLCEIRQII